MTLRTTPPFRADHVGSFLRPAALKEARAKHARGELDAAGLKAVEDREIRNVIRRQEEIGLQLATDGEFRRSWWHFDFFGRSTACELARPTTASSSTAFRRKPRRSRSPARWISSDHPMLAHFTFLKAHRNVTPKMTIPAPSVLHFRQGRESVSKRRLSRHRRVLRRPRRRLQQGDPRLLRCRLPLPAARRHRLGLSLLGGASAQQARERGDDPTGCRRSTRHDQQGARSKARRHDGHHACLPRQFPLHLDFAQGGYEPVAERCSATCTRRLLPRIRHRPRRRLRAAALPAKGKKIVVLGLVTSKSGALEKKDDIKRRIDEATKFVALDQLCLSPQCGFASTEEGNVLAEDEQWAKLRDDRRAGGRGLGLMTPRNEKEMTMPARTTPPFRADHVGSLLRTAALKDARAKREKGEIDAPR